MRLVLWGIAVLILAGCASTELTSYTDPAYRGPARFSSVMVYGENMGLEDRQLAETQMAEALQRYGVRAYRSIDYAPPTRGDVYKQMADEVIRLRIDAVLMLVQGEQYTSDSYVPPTYHPGTTYGSINNGSVYLQTTPGYTTGGYSVSKPRSQFGAVLLDSDGFQEAWQADGISRGGGYVSFRELTISASNETVRKLVSDGLLVTTTVATASSADAVEGASRSILDEYGRCVVFSLDLYDNWEPSAPNLVRRAQNACTEEANAWRDWYIAQGRDRRQVDRAFEQAMNKVYSELVVAVEDHRARGIALTEIIDLL